MYLSRAFSLVKSDPKHHFTLGQGVSLPQWLEEAQATGKTEAPLIVDEKQRGRVCLVGTVNQFCDGGPPSLSQPQETDTLAGGQQSPVRLPRENNCCLSGPLSCIFVLSLSGPDAMWVWTRGEDVHDEWV